MRRIFNIVCHRSSRAARDNCQDLRSQKRHVLDIFTGPCVVRKLFPPDAAGFLLCRFAGLTTRSIRMSLGFTLWNMEDGFVDAMVRGWRSTFLTDVEYSNLKEGGRRGDAKAKEDFEDMRLTLQETDYGNFLAAEVRRTVAISTADGRGIQARLG